MVVYHAGSASACLLLLGAIGREDVMTVRTFGFVIPDFDLVVMKGVFCMREVSEEEGEGSIGLVTGIVIWG